MKKADLLKLAEDLEALSNDNLSDTSIADLYKRLKKEAQSKVDDNAILEDLKEVINSMGELQI